MNPDTCAIDSSGSRGDFSTANVSSDHAHSCVGFLQFKSNCGRCLLFSEETKPAARAVSCAMLLAKVGIASAGASQKQQDQERSSRRQQR